MYIYIVNILEPFYFPLKGFIAGEEFLSIYIHFNCTISIGSETSNIHMLARVMDLDGDMKNLE